MPIRPENIARYPKEWPDISRHIRFKRARGRCECTGQCGAMHMPRRCTARHGRRHPVTRSIVVLTVMHLNHKPEDCAGTNLLAACQLCHNRYDAQMRAAGIKERKSQAKLTKSKTP